MNVISILDQIDLGALALPEFQRGYVWNGVQVREFMYSLYRRYPVGSLLVWSTNTDENARGESQGNSTHTQLLLDGQQRISTLYGIIRGKTPPFFHGKESVLKELYFNIETESFEYYGPIKMKDNPIWISVTDLMQNGTAATMAAIPSITQSPESFQQALDRLNNLFGIQQIALYIEVVTGDKNIDVVVDIFNRVNSGGTKLSKGDLALATICSDSPTAREELTKRITKWNKGGYNFKLDWLLRCINTDLNGRVQFTALRGIRPEDFESGLRSTEKRIDRVLVEILERLGLDHDRVLGAKLAIPVITRYMATRKNLEEEEIARLIHWFMHASVRGRYAGSAEQKLQRDLRVLDEENGISSLEHDTHLERGHRSISVSDFGGSTKGDRFYVLLYSMARMQESRDWSDGQLLSINKCNPEKLTVYNIFPKSELKKNAYTKHEINAIANFALTHNRSDFEYKGLLPHQYLPKIEEQFPGVLRSQWIPMDPDLWQVENYLNFLRTRRELLSEAANSHLRSLIKPRIRSGQAKELELKSIQLEPEFDETALGSIDSDEEQLSLEEINVWLLGEKLPQGEIGYVLDGPNGVILNIDLAWPKGLQTNLSEPVAILIDETSELVGLICGKGYLVFTNISDFKKYVQDKILSRAKTPIEKKEQEFLEEHSKLLVSNFGNKIFEKYQNSMLQTPTQIREKLFHYLPFIRSVARGKADIDLSTAIMLYMHLSELIDYIGEEPAEPTLRLVQGVVGYLGSKNNQRADLVGGGLNDDLLLFNQVSTTLGRVDLIIDRL